jgi:hypothetical protein
VERRWLAAGFQIAPHLVPVFLSEAKTDRFFSGDIFRVPEERFGRFARKSEIVVGADRDWRGENQ